MAYAGRPFELKKRKTVEIECGALANVTLDIGQGGGPNFAVEISVMTESGYKCVGLYPKRGAAGKSVVLGPDGKVIQSAGLHFGCGGVCEYSGRVAGDKTGKFTVKVTLDSGEYQGKVSASREIEIPAPRT